MIESAIQKKKKKKLLKVTLGCVLIKSNFYLYEIEMVSFKRNIMVVKFEK